MECRGNGVPVLDGEQSLAQGCRVSHVWMPLQVAQAQGSDRGTQTSSSAPRCSQQPGASRTSGDITKHIFYFGRIERIFGPGLFHPQHHHSLHQGKLAAWVSRERYKYHFSGSFRCNCSVLTGQNPRRGLALWQQVPYFIRRSLSYNKENGQIYLST